MRKCGRSWGAPTEFQGVLLPPPSPCYGEWRSRLCPVSAKPDMLRLPAIGLYQSEIQLQVLIPEAVMPSALLMIVFTSSYGRDAKMVFTTTLASCVTLFMIFCLMG